MLSADPEGLTPSLKWSPRKGLEEGGHPTTGNVQPDLNSLPRGSSWRKQEAELEGLTVPEREQDTMGRTTHSYPL